jgi:hypothetical protein
MSQKKIKKGMEGTEGREHGRENNRKKWKEK